MKILVMGLPGSGKTTLSKQLAHHFMIPHMNADVIRELYNDWQFDYEGRQRQAARMRQYWGILDFVCPTEYLRRVTQPDYIIWMDTVKQSKFEDTNKLFEPPDVYDIRIKKWIGQNQLDKCLEDFNPGIKGIKSFLNESLPTLVK